MGVEIRLNTPVTPELIRQIKPHTVINAIGAEPVTPPIPGCESAFVIQSHDVLDGKKEAAGNCGHHRRRNGRHGDRGVSCAEEGQR